ncbi:uncharacterized protein RSE6_11044 [Rhynchosporium secalis]|uniref:Uncharacterized protein n=1 Tax=Rhynchosporium secalis TaxID=38038 RepID=A0A1E1MM05_RHYSE|nr:uncharacterized protein RSE6_11044 [Rhynchosporium secalis]
MESKSFAASPACINPSVSFRPASDDGLTKEHIPFKENWQSEVESMNDEDPQ